MGNAGHGTSFYAQELFDKAVAEGRLDDAWMRAIQVPHLTLDRALRLTVLMAQEDGPGAERLARRFLVRFIREYKPSMQLLGMVVEALRAISRDGFLGEDSRDELRALADRMAAGHDVASWSPGP